MSNFGEVQYDEGAAGTANGGTTGQPAETVAIDPNDPLLTSEPLEMNLDANAYDVPPPPPDGLWRAQLKQVDINDAAGKAVQHRLSAFGKPGEDRYQPFYAVNVGSYLIDLSGCYDELELIDYWVKTAVMRRAKTSQAASILLAGGEREAVTRARTQADVLALLEKMLAGQPTLVVQTEWQWSCRTDDEKAAKQGKAKPGVFRRGMASAAADGRGGRNPVVACPSCGGQCRAQARVVNYLPASTKPTQGLGGGQQK